MTFGKYLKEQILNILIYILVLVFTGLILYASQVSIPYILLIVGIQLLAFIAILTGEYIRRHRFYQELEKVEAGLEKKYLLSDMISEPAFLEGKLFYRALRDAGQQMDAHVTHYRDVVKDYRTFLTHWIEEVKDPIEKARVISERSTDEAMDRVDEYLDCMDSYTDQVFYFMKGNYLEKDYTIREVSLKDLVYSVLKHYEKWFQKSGVDYQMDRLEVNVRTDPQWMTFILGQIVENAILYRKRQGEEDFQSKSHLLLLAEKAGEKTCLHIRDNGMGIAASELPKVMERGYTGTNQDRYPKASGMGLYLANRLAQRMSQEIRIQSDLGIGTTVTVIF